MQLTVLGASGSYASPALGPASGYLLRSAGANLWIDCGSGTFANLQRHLPVEDLTAVVVSHRHADHCTDLLGLYVCLKYGLDRGGVPVLAAPETRDLLEPFVGRFGDVFAWDEVDEGDERVVADLRLRFSRTEHPVPTVAVEVTGQAAGAERRLVYTSDTGPGWSPSAFAPGADLVLSEATYQRGGARTEALHLTAHEAGEAARGAGARRLVVTHLWPALDPVASVAEASEAFGDAVTLAAPHLTTRI